MPAQILQLLRLKSAFHRRKIHKKIELSPQNWNFASVCLIWSLKSCICSGTSVHPQKTINQLPWSLHRGLSTFLDTFHSSTFFGFGKKEMNPLLDSIHSLDSYKKESFEQWLNSFQKWEEEEGGLTKCCSTTLLISALILDNVPWEVVLLHVYLKNPTISKSPQHFYQLLKIRNYF